MSALRTRRPRHRVATLLATAAVAALALSACSSDGGEPAASGSAGESADFGEISVQYSWIKNEEFAGEFYAYDKGYYDEAGFSDVIGIAGPDTGVAKLLSGSVQVARAAPDLTTGIGAATVSTRTARPAFGNPAPNALVSAAVLFLDDSMLDHDEHAAASDMSCMPSDYDGHASDGLNSIIGH